MLGAFVPCSLVAADTVLEKQYCTDIDTDNLLVAMALDADYIHSVASSNTFAADMRYSPVCWSNHMCLTAESEVASLVA